MNYLGKYVCHIYIALWVIYYLQDWLMIKGVIAQAILVLVLMMSFYAFFQVNVFYRTGAFIKWLNVMLVVLSIYGVIPIIGEWTLAGSGKVGVSWMTYLYLQNVYISILPIYFFYQFTLIRHLTSHNLFFIFVVFLLFSVLMYYKNYYFVSKFYDMEEITNNAGYFFVPLIPMLQLLKIKDIWKYIFITIIFVYLLMAMKRGAVIAGAVMVIMFMIHHFKYVSWKKKYYLLCLSVIVLSAISYFMIILYADSDYFQGRIEQTLSGDSSGRNDMYHSYLTYFLERTTVLEFLIGNGTNSTYVLFGDYAHNDWIEFAINQGIIGLLMYLVYWIAFIWEWKNYCGDINSRNTLGDIIFAYFLIALYSMSFDGMPIAAGFCIGYCLAMNEKVKTANLIKEVRNRIINDKNTSFD